MNSRSRLVHESPLPSPRVEIEVCFGCTEQDISGSSNRREFNVNIGTFPQHKKKGGAAFGAGRIGGVSRSQMSVTSATKSVNSNMSDSTAPAAGGANVTESPKICVTRRNRQLMRQVSGLGMEDPTGVEEEEEDKEETELEGATPESSTCCGGQAAAAERAAAKTEQSFSHPCLMLFNDMTIDDFAPDMKDLISVASDPTARTGNGLDKETFQATLAELCANESSFSHLEFDVSAFHRSCISEMEASYNESLEDDDNDALVFDEEAKKKVLQSLVGPTDQHQPVSPRKLVSMYL